MGSSQSTEEHKAFDPKKIYFDNNGNLRLGEKSFNREAELKKVLEADVMTDDMTDEEKVRGCFHNTYQLPAHGLLCSY